MKRLEFLLVLLCGLLPVLQVSGFQHSHDDELPDLDKRKAKVTQLLPGKKAASERLKGNLPDAQIELDEITGAPRSISSRSGFLSGKHGVGRGLSTNGIAGKNEEHRVTRAFLREHKELFGHGPEALQDATVKRDYTTQHNGLKTTVWQQELDGIPIFEALFISHVTKDEELVNVSSRFVSNPVNAADRGVKDRKNLLAKPPVSAKRAIANAAANVGEEIAAEGIEALGATANEPRRQTFRSAKLPGKTYAELVWLPIHANELRLCWQVILTRPEHSDMFLLLVDAQNGEVLVRRGLTRHSSDVTYNVFTVESPTPMSPGHSSPITNQPPVVARELVTFSAISTNASPFGWINEGVNETIGNNVEAHLDRSGDDFPDLPRPEGSPFRVFDPALDLGQSPATYGDASVVQLFYWCNWMHDKLYELGFTEEAGNFQQTNSSQGGFGGDAVQADAQDNYNGVSRNNANFSAPPDGIPGRMQLFIYTRSGSEPDLDPALDAQIVLHEYTHGLSDRLVGGGMGMTKLQSRGMGEGWSDFYALALLSSPTNDVHASYPFGAYVARKLFPASFEFNYYYGARRYPYSTDLAKNPLTFKDIDQNQLGTYPSVPRATLNATIAGNADAVHNQGEIWCAALWEARANLITKHGFSIGNNLILQLVTDGMKLCPPNPNFLQSRDAILKADQVNNDGANHPELWAAFAKRGMGFFASSPDSNKTIGVVESFAMPDSLSIEPKAGLISSGPSGGPFVPNLQTYALSNISPQTITWSIQDLASWLNASSSGGTLTASNGLDVAISIKQSVAGNLPSGLYTNIVVFMNETTEIAQTRRFILRIGQPDSFTELFEVNDFDLGHQSFTFTPDDSNSFYSVCAETVTDFYSDPTGGTLLPLGDDEFEKITLPANVSFYGNSAIELFIGSNGYITFGSGDDTYVDTSDAHFTLPRISALFTDLVPPTNSVSWKAFTNRIAVTYLNVAEYGTFRTNSFQIELFFDSRIRITYLALETRNGVVGLSRGTGVPASFVESDFSSYPECAPAIQVWVPALVSESDGIVNGQVSIHEPLTTNLTVNLFSSDNSQATVPLQVILPAEQTSVAFDITIVDDEFLDGTQPVTITAVAGGYQNGRATMRIDDNEEAVLAVIFPDFITEGEGLISGTVFIQDSAAAADVEVQLQSLNPSRLTVDSSVVIPAGESFASFNATVLDNEVIDGHSVVTVTANVAGWVEGIGTLFILDDENRNLRLKLPTVVREGNGTLPQAGSVHISGTWPEDLVIGLTSDSPTEVSVPEVVVIPAGSKFVTFNITVGDDSILDGPQSAQVTAYSADFVSDQKTITVEDDETPLPVSNPRPAHLSLDNPVTVNLEWDPSPGEGIEQLINGNFESGTLAGWTLQTDGNNSFNVFSGSYGDSAFAPFAGQFALVGTQTNAGTQTLVRQVELPDIEVVTVSWADLIHNVSSSFAANHQFRVELRNTNNAVLTVLFSTSPDFQSTTDWTERTFNVSQYRGTAVRLAFVTQTTEPGLTVLLDEISVRTASPPETTYDVYFGTNASLDVSEFLGSTTNLFWDLPVSDPFTRYFWKIVSRRLGEASSPIWEFETMPTISVEDISLAEGHSGFTTAIFTLILSIPSPDVVTVDFTTINGSAVAGEDFVETNGVIQFQPGETNQTIEVLIIGDTDFEEHETFSISFSNPQFAGLARAEATCTILDDDYILSPISNKTVNEGSLLTFTAQADHTNQLAFTLTNAPAGASIDPDTGVFSWTPTETQGPGVYIIEVNATDGVEINETRTFTVTVNEVNTTPLLSVISNQTIDELTTLSFFASATDNDLPTNGLIFTLDSAPQGASIHPATGSFTWTPTEAQGPGTNTIVVRVTDDGLPNLSATRTFLVFVSEVNSVPVLSPIADQFVYASSSLTLPITAVDNDIPANILTFSLLGTPPSGAGIDSSSGLFTWPNIAAPVGSTNMVTVRVQDNGSPALAASETFAVIVLASPVIQTVELLENEITINWSAIPGRSYRVQYATTLQPTNWEDLEDVVAQGTVASLTEFFFGAEQRFYRILVLP
ncbi:MAG: M36 family metallopeptidase [Verrucomicrobia bacterium]|nr:M36 family metallopeptidase [Verrucomicrobiota bacterium]